MLIGEVQKSSSITDTPHMSSSLGDAPNKSPSKTASLCNTTSTADLPYKSPSTSTRTANARKTRVVSNSKETKALFI